MTGPETKYRVNYERAEERSRMVSVLRTSISNLGRVETLEVLT